MTNIMMRDETKYLTKFKFDRPVSYSRITSYLDCPKQYEMKYLSATPVARTTHISAILGTAFHEGIAQFYRDIKIGKKVTRGDEYYDVMKMKIWSQIVEHGDGARVNYNIAKSKFTTQQSYEDYMDKSNAEAYQTAKDLLEMAINDYYKEKEDEWEVVEVEVKFEGKLPNVDKYPGIGDTEFTGFIDKIDRHKISKLYRVVDHKSSKSFEDAKTFTDLQLPMYAYVATHIFGWPTSNAAYNIFTIGKELKHTWLRVDMHQDRIRRMLEELNCLLPLMKWPLYPRRAYKYCTSCEIFTECMYGRDRP